MLASIFVNYICGIIIENTKFKYKTNATIPVFFNRINAALLASIVFNLFLLGVFKYYNFGLENGKYFLGLLGINYKILDSFPSIVLPLGISFYTFQSMSYTIDVYRGNTKTARNIIDFACYVTMFPQLIAGPIVRYKDISKQIVSRNIKLSNIQEGIERFIIGLSKKVLIANSLALTVDLIFSIQLDLLTFQLAWIGTICYTLQIYFDFSGYSDMAIGIGKMLGFSFPENFNYPYISSSIREFWRRWHISLSTWFKDYLYIPLGGNRKSTLRTYLNLWMVFILCGLWHGASWNFIFWGAYHGAFLIIERLGFESFLKDRTKIIQHFYALIVIMCGWVFFRSENMSYALSYLFIMINPFKTVSKEAFAASAYLRSDILVAICFGIVFSTPITSKIYKVFENISIFFIKKISFTKPKYLIMLFF